MWPGFWKEATAVWGTLAEGAALAVVVLEEVVDKAGLGAMSGARSTSTLI